MTIPLRQSTANQEIPIGVFLDSTDGDTEETGLTISNTDIKLWKNGATTLVNKNSGGADHMSNGVYYGLFDATDSNTLGGLVIFVHEAGALTVKVDCVVYPANVYDSLFSTDKLQVDVTQIGGTTQSATDLKDFADAGYDPATNKVQGVVLTDTCTTNTDMVGTDNAALAATALSDATWTNAKAAYLDHSIATVDTVADGIQTDLSNATDGLGALKALIDTIDGIVDTILTDTNDLQTNQGAWATATGFSTHSAANVWAVAARTLTANTNFNDLDAAAIKAEVVAALADIKLDHLINIAVDTNWATTVHLDSVIGHLADVGTAATFDRTTDAQEAIRDRGDAEWITATGFNTVVPDAAGVAPTAAEIKTEVEQAGSSLAQILADTGELQTNQGNWLTATGFSTHNAAAVWSVAARVLTANTNFNDLTAAEVKAEVAAALQDIKLDHLVNSAVDTNWATTVHLDSVIGHLADVGTSATFDRTTDALEAIRNRGDGAWITATGFNTVVPDAAGVAPTVGEIRTEMEGAGTKLLAIEGDTNELQTDWVNGGRLDNLLDACNTVVPDAAGVAPTAAEIKTAVEQAGSSIAQILADTDNLQTNQGGWATATTVALNAQGKLDVNAEVDTALADIKLDHLLNIAVDTNWATTVHLDSVIGHMADVGTAATFNRTTDALEAIRNRGDAAWVTATGFNTTTPPTVTQIRQEMDTNSTKMAPSQVLADYKATGFNTVVPDAAGVAATPAEVATALTDIHLDHLLATDYDPASKPGVATALLNELIESDGGISRYTANALEQAPSAGTDPNVLIDTTIASVSDQTHFILTAGSNDNDAYKDQVIVIYDANDSDFPSIRVCSGYVGATKTITLDSAPDFTIVSGDGCRAFVTVPVTTAPTVGQIRAEMEGAGYKLATIEADTNELQTNQGNWATATGFNTVVPDAAGIAAGLHATTDGLITTVDTVADGIQTDLSNATDGLGALKALIDANQTDLTNIESKVDTVDTVADGIQTDLSNGTDGLGALKTLIDTIDGVVDTILTDTGTTLDGKLDTILGLGQENFFIDNTTYAGGNMTGARVRIYSVAGSVGTASDVIATYTVTATYAGSEMTDYKVVKS